MAPAIQQNMVVTPGEIMFGVSRFNQRKAHQRCFLQIKSTVTVVGQEFTPSLIAFSSFTVAPVFLVPPKTWLPDYSLHRFAYALPYEARAENCVPFCHLLPSTPEGVGIDS